MAIVENSELEKEKGSGENCNYLHKQILAKWVQHVIWEKMIFTQQFRLSAHLIKLYIDNLIIRAEKVNKVNREPQPFATTFLFVFHLSPLFDVMCARSAVYYSDRLVIEVYLTETAEGRLRCYQEAGRMNCTLTESYSFAQAEDDGEVRTRQNK